MLGRKSLRLKLLGLLCTDGYPQTRDDYCEKMFNAGIEIRAAQYRTFLDFYNAGDKNIGFVSTYDLRRRWYHPQLKIPAGERIARWALATQYGFDKQVEWKPPMLLDMEPREGALLLKLDTDASSASLDRLRVPVASRRNSTVNPRWTACRAVLWRETPGQIVSRCAPDQPNDLIVVFCWGQPVRATESNQINGIMPFILSDPDIRSSGNQKSYHLGMSSVRSPQQWIPTTCMLGEVHIRTRVNE
ncbi:hypothetical protein Pla8534_67310 [Lignipirellula cremea]|uniref:Uncharacterized protein n=1 Tax=Lignipirellula cremea TaxID=2528010 RepID=A0A518E404_9BACT|nr:hypothetical protein Pla8534_67310 [Lignipirellula cremea]